MTANESVRVETTSGKRCVSPTTYLRRVHAEGLDREPHLPLLRAVDLMSGDVATTWPGEALADAVDRLYDRHVDRLVVVDRPGGSRPVGILSMTDVVRAIEE